MEQADLHWYGPHPSQVEIVYSNTTFWSSDGKCFRVVSSQVMTVLTSNSSEIYSPRLRGMQLCICVVVKEIPQDHLCLLGV